MTGHREGPVSTPSFDLENARQQSGLSMAELWFACVGLGGTAMPPQLHAYVLGRSTPDRHEYNVVAQALNERFADMDLDHPVPYFDELGPDGAQPPPAR